MWDPREVRLCTAPDCPLYPYRLRRGRDTRPVECRDDTEADLQDDQVEVVDSRGGGS